jgi:hypothetical protein
VAAAGGRVLSIAKLKVGDGKKAAAAEAGLSQGDRLE